MDRRTGKIHEMLPVETLEGRARRLGGEPSDFVPVATNEALPVCRRCQGKGFVRAGLNSKRFKPCKCVL